MGVADTTTKEYMRGSKVFADAFNYFIYGGEKVVDPEFLHELDTTEIAIPFTLDGKSTREEAVQKYRDVLKAAVVMRDERDRKGHNRGEYLSGFYKEDRISPVVTLVVHFGAEEWDGPVSLS